MSIEPAAAATRAPAAFWRRASNATDVDEDACTGVTARVEDLFAALATRGRPTKADVDSAADAMIPMMRQAGDVQGLGPRTSESGQILDPSDDDMMPRRLGCPSSMPE